MDVFSWLANPVLVLTFIVRRLYFWVSDQSVSCRILRRLNCG